VPRADFTRPLVSRYSLLTAAFVLLMSSRSFAAPCVPDNLTNYLSVGSCSIGSLAFGNFNLVTPLPTGATPIPTNGISVTPFNSATGIGFLFGFDVSSDATFLRELLFGYQVSGAGLNGATLEMSGATAADDGVVTGVQDVCNGGVFSPGLGSCSGVRNSNVVFAIDGDQLLNSSLLFASASFLDIVNDIAVDGGLTGGASLAGNVTNRFAVAAAAVPEPTTGLLVASGLGLLLRRRRRALAHA
jgi:hypothetical protein